MLMSRQMYLPNTTKANLRLRYVPLIISLISGINDGETLKDLIPELMSNGSVSKFDANSPQSDTGRCEAADTTIRINLNIDL
jgi:hypothetical protein